MSENIFKSKYLNKAINLSDIYSPKDEKDYNSDTDSESETEIFDNFIIDSKPESKIQMVYKDKKKRMYGSSLQTGLQVKPYLSSGRQPEESAKLVDQMSLKAMNEELSKKLVIKPGFEQNYCIKPLTQSKRMRKKIRKEENAKTLGQKWFGMRAQEMTDEKKTDLLALSMRRGWDRKRFYKKNESKELPKFFQIGTVVESKADYYHSRVPKRDRKRTIVDELMADAEFKRFNKKKYSEALAKHPYYLKMKRRKQRQELKAKGVDLNQKRNNKSKHKKQNSK